MAEPVVTALREAGASDVVDGARLSDLTTLGVGGPVGALVTAESDTDLAAVGTVADARDLPWLVVGRGSNLLVADRGWPGIVVRLGLGRGGPGVAGWGGADERRGPRRRDV
jgi:UDP-N-acetylmuramate dehydrogenase